MLGHDGGSEHFWESLDYLRNRLAELDGRTNRQLNDNPRGAELPHRRSSDQRGRLGRLGIGRRLSTMFRTFWGKRP